jgi:CheY-like chemotaxis protein
MQDLAQRLLVVEDDSAVARALSRLLSKLGFSVIVARSCRAATALTQSFETAILDLDLPDGNGVDLARQLLAAGKVRSVLFFTGSSDAKLLARARRRGSVIMKASGTGQILSLLAPEALEAPQSGTGPSQRARNVRTSASTIRKSRAR